MPASPDRDAQAALPITILSGDGPDADRLGRPQGYPACVQALTRVDCRVGTWSAQHSVSATRVVSPSANPLPLPPMERPPAVSFRWQGETLGVDAYLAQTQATGLIIVKDGRIVLERYRYGRGPDMPMRSFSMAKTVTSMLVGIAHDKGLIRSLDDEAAAYWPQIAGSAYGRTTIRNLLRMGSGVTFRELYTRTPEDDNWAWNLVLTAPANRGRPERVVDYLNGRPERSAPQGTRFQYASIETEILGRVLVRATGRSIASLTEAWLWQPMGAQSPARWLFAAADSVESVGGGFNATLRDWARLGVLLANDGRRDGVPIVPRDYLLEATDAARQPEGFRPGRATPGYGYGYQTWLLPMRTRTFALQGIHGQFVFVQPDSGIVMVQTSVFDQPSGRMDPRPYQRINALWRGVLDSLGGDSRAR